MTLIEVVVAMGLVSVILVAILGFYHQMDVMKVKSEKLHEENFKVRYAQNRLSDVLTRALPFDDNEKDSYFYVSLEANHGMQKGGLVFTYDNKVNLNPLFANRVLGRLYLEKKPYEKNGTLCLITWPSLKRSEKMIQIPAQKEILLDKVVDISFKFFTPPDPSHEKKVAPKQIEKGKEVQEPEAGKWTDEWRKEYKKLPALVQVTIEREKDTKGTTEELIFAYPIPNTKYHITYVE